MNRVLVAGVGNIFLGDDAFGVEVARRLAARPLPDEVRVVDFGIRGMDLAYALCDGYDAVIIVDAAGRGQAPGTLYVIEPDVEGEAGPDAPLSPHGMDLGNVFRLARQLGTPLPLLRLVGCEPACLGSEEEPAMGLSQPVQAAVDEAVRMVETLVQQLTGERGALAP